MKACLYLLAALTSFAFSTEFDCNRALTDFRDDEAILDMLKQQQKETGVKGLPMDCIYNLIRGNHFESASFAIQNSKASLDAKELLQTAKGAALSVRDELETVREKAEAQKKLKAVTMTPPFVWYQNLNNVYVEIKFAYRHDVSGCATLFGEKIEITDDKFYMSAYCAEDQDNNVFFELEFPFWAKVKSEAMKMERVPVGKIIFTLPKVDSPARWRHVYNEESKRPPTGRLNLAKLAEVHTMLYDFEDDDIEDFEGWDLIEVEAEKDRDDMTWLFPTKGPGKFKKTKKSKKKGKKGKKVEL